MPRSNKTSKVPHDMINIGFFEPDYTKEHKAFKQTIEKDGKTYRFVCDHELPTSEARYGRWVEDD